MTNRPAVTPPARPADPTAHAHAVLKDGDAFLRSIRGDEAWRFGGDDSGGGVWSFSRDEHQGLETVRDRIQSYLKFADHQRPLCVAVFGPPGSGKSSGVKEVFRQLQAGDAASRGNASLRWVEFNLTQFYSTDALARAVAAAVESPMGTLDRSKKEVPFIFFDEFDAALNGAPLGWLSWFLAPMQDGTFVADGRVVSLAQAVYVFAGGTAATMADFGARGRGAFRDAKGPDFVSRLHAYLDVRGPNDPGSRTLRRGRALQFALGAVGKRTGHTRTLDGALVDDMVHAGRYRYGQRSVEAVVTMMAERAGHGGPLGRGALPPDFLLGMQVDRGPLDPDTIGGLVGLSGGGAPAPSAQEDRNAMWVQLAQCVWALGGTVAYGGKWHLGGLTRALLGVALPGRLRRDGGDGARLEIHARTPPPAELTLDARTTVVTVSPPVIPGASEPVRHVAHLFRMRWQSGCRCRARVLLSGKTDAFSGRMPGIVEEAMIALALRQPLYVLGGFGGAAAQLGELLGLSTAAPVPMPAEAPPLDLEPVAHVFRPAGFETLPLTTADALAYVAGHAIGGPGWVPNGLTVDENRALFALRGAEPSEREEAIRLVQRGLLRTFDT